MNITSIEDIFSGECELATLKNLVKEMGTYNVNM